MYIAHMFDHPLYAKASIVEGEGAEGRLDETGQ
jgi:hypothetical protein